MKLEAWLTNPKLMKNDTPQFIPITKIIDETPNVKTFYFDYNLNSQPGQFVMLWIPGIDQKPFSISSDNGQVFSLTIFKRGPLTEKLFTLTEGDRVGISGPYGTNFSIQPDFNYIMVAGGYGAAPLTFLTEKLRDKFTKIDFCLGARTAGDLLFEDRLAKIPNLKLHLATDDGSKGHQGFVTDLLDNIINQNANKKLVVTCGPELMEKTVLNFCNQYNLDCEVSVERFMKCGFGVCGQCAVDDLGICMCTYGPVVKKDLLNHIKEFGHYHRLKSGTKQNQ